jgi:hypothetical protein
MRRQLCALRTNRPESRTHFAEVTQGNGEDRTFSASGFLHRSSRPMQETATRFVRSLCEVRNYVEQRGLSPGFPQKRRIHAAHNFLLAWEPRSSSHHPPNRPKRLFHAFSGRFSVVAHNARGDKTRHVATASPRLCEVVPWDHPREIHEYRDFREPA